MKFITKVYHPNVSSASGAICLDILKDAWSPVLTLKSTLISLQSLLCSPEPNDPQDAEVAKHYTTSKRSFEETAVYWTKTYATPRAAAAAAPTTSDGAKDEVAIAGLEAAHVDRFEALGFPRAKVVSIVSRPIGSSFFSRPSHFISSYPIHSRHIPLTSIFLAYPISPEPLFRLACCFLPPSSRLSLLCLSPYIFRNVFSHLYSQIDVLRRLNYRGANVAQINDDRVVEELLK
jgi:hypothetical protein